MTKKKLDTYGADESASSAVIENEEDSFMEIEAGLKITSFNEMEPVQQKCWLDYSVAQHGDIQYWSRDEFKKMISDAQRTQHAEIMNNHAIDRRNLCQQYAKKLAHANVNVIYFAANKVEGHCEVAAKQNEGKSVPDWKLEIYPNASYGFNTWVATGRTTEVFPGPQDATIVYLHVPGNSRSDYSVTLQLEDLVFWLNGSQVVGAASIVEVLHDDIVVLKDALIVPVIAKPFDYRFSPFDLSEIKFENRVEKKEFLQYVKRKNAGHKRQNVLGADHAPQRPTPICASEIDMQWGTNILVCIDDAYHVEKERFRETVSAMHDAQRNTSFLH